MTRIVLLLGLAGSIGLDAQTMHVAARIPFEFRVGDTLLPAGDYVIRHSQNVLVLSGMGKKSAGAVAFSHPATRTDFAAKGEVVFQRYGDTYFLSRLWTPASLTGTELRKSPLEKELAARSGLVQSASIPLRGR